MAAEVLQVSKVLLMMIMCMMTLKGGVEAIFPGNSCWHGYAGTYGDAEYISVNLELERRWNILGMEQVFLWWQDIPGVLNCGYRSGTWSVDDDVLVLKFNNNEIVTGKLSEKRLLLDYNGGLVFIPHSGYWWGATDDMTLSVLLMPDSDGVSPLDSQRFIWQRHDHPKGSSDVVQLNGGEYRQGTWSVKEDILKLRFDDGETLIGVYGSEGLLLAYEGGILLDKSNYMYID